jgi:hypothetical protein
MTRAFWSLCNAMLACVLRGAAIAVAVLPPLLLCAGAALAQGTPARQDDSRIQALEQRIQQLESTIRNASQERTPAATVSGPQSPVKNADSVCPPGSYVFGVESWGAAASTKYCIGCMTGLRVLCRKLLP